ncbi:MULTISPECIES: DNA mismatch repair endonuclease MutL [Providencia]|uniref:DNA mismatch repair endonuclease MutL n=1 Tax=Providencia TaxID=586 RepID=UPI00197D3F77|nr:MULTISPECIES: DNA mismatch repair endonuclease MutL [Providencia]MBN4864894.1 DNA mismatch repair endonuclease MutL [Providencia stuartii]MBN4873660.1 DNA mismatch repair endonuclease MutL [Providencia stuartii]MBN4878351.1 DNA mismatch repair endonuclease MutL [Providencia stuartii]MBN4883416.1 DNA mismatch repair endonuclease MutL [Providencia stuartii]
MAIHILSPQLANQIAAGEVVERPASVVKELVENSLDAKATRIDIDIERGGEKLIRIRDNGCGINKDELILALARHATSKIATLDDLEAIMSMGFRGEALASISSVSRLTLTSKPAEQTEAWQSYAEGRDMEVTVKPAAHPNGTTVEVLDLFYNTPARRKFMRTEKTEFGHIDEVVRRIALSRPDVSINLTHNGKLVKQYRAAHDEVQQERRLGTICGTGFMQGALALSWEHSDLAIKGWVVSPSNTPVSETQYCYVNGRMMRDRLINHAIRQAFEGYLEDNQQPAYVLYLTIDPKQVDVNVHPAKHEVRFHQARLVHDFIYQAVRTVLLEAASISELPGIEPVHAELENRSSAGGNYFSSPTSTSKPNYTESLPQAERTAREPQVAYKPATTATSSSSLPKSASQFVGNVEQKNYGTNYDKKAGDLYQSLMSIPVPETEKKPLFPERQPVDTSQVSSQPVAKNADNYLFGKVLTIYSKNFALIESSLGLILLSLTEANYLLKLAQLSPEGENLKPQPLLIPLKLSLKNDEIEVLQRYKEQLAIFGIEATIFHGKVTIHTVSLPLRTQNLSQLFSDLIGFLSTKESITQQDIAQWLAKAVSQVKTEESWSLAQAVQLLADVERICPQWVKNPPPTLLQLINLQSVVATLTNE